MEKQYPLEQLLEQPLTIFKSMSGNCHNPLCMAPLGPRKRKPRLYCSDRCRMDTWALRRVAAKLVPMGPAGAWELLQGLGNGDSQGKARAEIVNPGAN